MMMMRMDTRDGNGNEEEEEKSIASSMDFEGGLPTKRASRRGAAASSRLQLALMAALLAVAILTLVAAVRVRSGAKPSSTTIGIEGEDDAPAVCQCGCDPVVCPAASPAPPPPPERAEVANAPAGRAILQQPRRAGSRPFTTRVDAGVLIPGRGEPMAAASVVFDDTNTILYVGPTAGVTLEADASYEVPVVMPGVWDTHMHFGSPIYGHDARFPDFTKGVHPESHLSVAKGLLALEELLLIGVTSVREVGGAYGQVYKHLLNQGVFPGPNFHYAGHAISMTSGHADLQTIPLNMYVGGDVTPTMEQFGYLCDGAQECVKRVRQNVRAEADAIKIMTTGGILTEFDSPFDAEFSVEEIRAIAEEAARSKRIVATHAYSPTGILNALRGGVKTIEHGNMLNGTVIDFMLENRDTVTWHPTSCIFNRDAVYPDRCVRFFWMRIFQFPAPRHRDREREAGVCFILFLFFVCPPD